MMTTDQTVRNFDEINPIVLPEIEGVVERAILAGARPPLTYLGAGATGIVFCDDEDVAWKVGRWETETSYRIFEAEAEWLHTARNVPGVREHVAEIYKWHPEFIVIERECLWGRPGVWADEGHLFDLTKKIEEAMIPHGWTAPEFKGDSWVRSEGRWVLVDAGMAHRIGDVLVDYAKDVISGTRKYPEHIGDLQFALRREQNVTVDPTEARDLISQLEEVRSVA